MATKQTLKKLSIVDELMMIKDMNNGLIDPVKVVEFARDPSTVLHNRFEWDDTEAAERYRIWQARSVIRMELQVIEGEKKPKVARTFVSLLDDRRAKGDRGYRAMLDVLSDEELRKSLLDEARRDMLIFRRKYDVLKELAGVFAAMDEVQLRACG